MFEPASEQENNSDQFVIPWWNSTTLNPAYATAEITIGVCAIIGNTLVILSFVRVASLRNHRNYQILSLAIADELLGLLNIPLNLIVSMGLPKNRIGCLISVSILDVPLYGSVMAFLVISMDRFWAVAWPYSYHKRMSKKLAIRICSVAWTIAFIVALFPLMGWHNRNGWKQAGRCFYRQIQDKYQLCFSHGVNVVVSLGVLIIVYSYLVRRLSQQAKHDRHTLPQNSRSRDSSISRKSEVSCHIIYMRLVSESHYALKIAKIVIVFVVCQLPLATIFWIRAFSSQQVIDKIPKSLSTYALLLLHANSALNPLLYAFHLSDFKMAIKDTCGAVFKCRRQVGQLNEISIQA